VPSEATEIGGCSVHDLSHYLLELLENSVRANAKQIRVGFLADHASDRLGFFVEDDGKGLTVAPERLLDPFYTTKANKKTGLGLSLLRAEAESANGGLTVTSPSQMGGVRIEAEMQLTHVDRPPFGDMAESLNVMAFTNPDVEFRVDLYGDEFKENSVARTIDQTREQLRRAAENLDRIGAGAQHGLGGPTHDD
jgi:hypothetical protein